ncbi:hypothetical protein [Martelella sp. AMO21009]
MLFDGLQGAGYAHFQVQEMPSSSSIWSRRLFDLLHTLADCQQEMGSAGDSCRDHRFGRGSYIFLLIDFRSRLVAFNPNRLSGKQWLAENLSRFLCAKPVLPLAPA